MDLFKEKAEHLKTKFMDVANKAKSENKSQSGKEYDFLSENEEIIMEGAANKRQLGGLASKGGTLILTNKRLIFKAGAFNLGSSFDEILFSDIEMSGKTLNLLMPTPNMIKIVTKDGTNHGFIVVGKEKEMWKQKIGKAVESYE